MQGKVEIAGVNTAKLKVLKNDETMELLRQTKEGNQEARRKLIEGNLRLVLSVIQRFSGRGENADDLFQVGCVGLIKAIDNFDISQGPPDRREPAGAHGGADCQGAWDSPGGGGLRHGRHCGPGLSL